MKRKIKFIAGLTFIIAFLFVSCKTVEPKPPVEPFGVIGQNADMYLYIPVKGNESFIYAITENIAEKSDIAQMVKRTNTIYAGVFLHDDKPEIRLCGIGGYPSGWSDSIFKEKNGWRRGVTEQNYKYYEARWLDISIPTKKVACVNLGSEMRQTMPDFLAKIDVPDTPELSDEFKNLAVENSENKIGLFINNPNYFLTQIIGLNLQLPLNNLEVYLMPNKTDKNIYNYEFNLETENKTSVFAMSMLFSKVLDAEIERNDLTVSIKNGRIDYETLSKILDSFYE